MKPLLPGRVLSKAIFIALSALSIAFPLALLSLYVHSNVYAAESSDKNDLRPFSSDGCSSFPDGTFEEKELWLSCCVTHDYSYWKGGTYAERLQADQDLQSCVAEVGEPEIAALMLIGVRVGGSPFWPSRFRWGYGWPYPHFYGTLTEAEQAQITAQGYQQGEEAETQ